MRKLASIQKIWKIEPIEGADKIELAYVLGWQCVVNKGQFKPMDLAVYFEIDSFLPIKPEYEFLRSSSYKNSDILGEGFKLKTMKFRGSISQGLLLPISNFPDIPKDIKLGTDVSELLGIRKWEIAERATTGGNVVGTLPMDVPHTDETRVQNEPN
jgi:RNA ligase (TIGR02306 family)